MNQMLCLSVVALVAALSMFVGGQPPDGAFRQEMQKNEQACQASEGATAADVEGFRNHQAPTTQTAKCFVGCVFEKMGLMSNGAFSRDLADQTAKAKITNNPGMLQNVLAQNVACEQEVGTSTDKCVTGPKLMLCLEKHMKH